jgi:tetratricopeptide (TPR) repeat protein
MARFHARGACKNMKKNALLLAIAFTAIVLLVSATRNAREARGEPILGEESLAAPADRATASSPVADAVGLFKARDYPGALKLWQEIAKSNADLPPPQVIMAQLFLQANMPRDAKAALEKAVVDAPRDPEVYLLIGEVAMRGGDLDKAAAMYQKAEGLLAAFDASAKRKDALTPRAYSGLAAVAERREKWPKARKVLETWLKADPKSAVAAQRLAHCLFQQQNPDQALAILRKAAEAGAEVMTPEAALAQFYHARGDRANADKWMQAALTAAPKDLKVRTAAGQMALDLGKTEEARQHANAAVRIAPKSLDAKYFRGVIAMLEKEYESAEMYFEQSLKQAPRNFTFSNSLNLALLIQEDAAKNRRGLELAEANAQQFPKSADAAATHAWALYRLGRLEEAEKAIRGASSIASSDIDAAYFTARIWSERDRKPEARQLLESALKNPKPFFFRRDAEELLQRLNK